VFRYVKSAFLVPVNIPGLGGIPLNVLAAAGFCILGFVEPSLWLLGLGLETTFLVSLAFNPRFQKWVDATKQLSSGDDTVQKRMNLIRALAPSLRDRLNGLQAQCSKAMELYRSSDAEGYVVETAFQNLDSLGWLYLKLLVAKQNLGNSTGESEESLSRKISDLQKSLEEGTDTEALHKSKTATLAILKKRLNVMRHKGQMLQEIDSDLMRLEAQVALAVENASVEGKPQAISTEIELASDLGGSLYGESESAIADLEEAYSHRGGSPKIAGPERA